MSKKLTLSCLHQLSKSFHALEHVKKCADQVAKAIHGDGGEYADLYMTDEKVIFDICNAEAWNVEYTRIEMTVSEVYSFKEYLDNLKAELRKQREEAEQERKAKAKAEEVLRQAKKDEEEKGLLLELIQKHGLPEEVEC